MISNMKQNVHGFFFAIMVSWQQGRIKGGGQLLLSPEIFFGKSEENVQRK